MTISYIEANTKGRERLCTLVSRLTDEELDLPAGDHWTVAAILAHLAFWDNRVLELIRRWKKVGVGRSPIDIDNVNDAMKPLCLAIPVVKQQASQSMQQKRLLLNWGIYLRISPSRMRGRVINRSAYAEP
jgi:hypothetical protein